MEPTDSDRPAEAPAPLDEAQGNRLSDDIGRLIEQFSQGDVTVREVVLSLRGRAYMALLLLLSIPFCTPVAIPGLSTPFGVMIALIGLRMAFRRKPWLPRALMDMRLPHKVFPSLLRAANGMVRGIEKVSKPRHEGWIEAPAMQHLAGFCIFCCGSVLCLPLPIPLTNLLPAAAVVSLSMASIGRDGVLAMVGYVASILTAILFGYIFVGGAAAIAWVKDHVYGWLPVGQKESGPGPTP
jgi:hypothetical protein